MWFLLGRFTTCLLPSKRLFLGPPVTTPGTPTSVRTTTPSSSSTQWTGLHPYHGTKTAEISLIPSLSSGSKYAFMVTYPTPSTTPLHPTYFSLPFYPAPPRPAPYPYSTPISHPLRTPVHFVLEDSDLEI